MKKQIRYIIIAGIILAVLIGALVFLLTMPNKEDDGKYKLQYGNNAH